MKELEELRKIFLADDLDEEDRLENEEKIKDWEKSLVENEAFLSWQNHDISKEISRKAKETYRDYAMVLMLNRGLTEAQRHSLWAKQDAALWIISLVEKDAKGELEQIQKDIKKALSVV